MNGQNLLENEANIMSYLNGPGLPIVKSFGYSSRHNILVMELMGKSLEDIFENLYVKKMSKRCVCNIGYQMIEILEYIHNKHIVHRDIKPDNFVVGRNEKRKYIYILDFGLSKKYRSSRTLKHSPIHKSKNLTGTARYASINALDGLSQSRRDDLEATGYVLMYFLRGKLPWQGIPAKNKEDRYRKIMEKKIATSPEELCNGFPVQFSEYIKYTRSLLYEQDPNYEYLKNLFTIVLNADGFGIDCYYDWDKETINYFRDFKSVLNKNDDKNSIHNHNDNNNESPPTNKPKDKSPIRFNNPGNNISNSYNDKAQGNTNSVSIPNNQGNKGSCFYDSTNKNDISYFGQKQNNQEIFNGNETNKNYIQDKNINNSNQNINYKSTELINNNLVQQDLNQQNNAIFNKSQENNNEQSKIGGMNPRPEKDNKCCSIF